MKAGPSDDGNGMGLRGGGKHVALPSDVLAARVVVPGYLFRLAIDTAGDPTITTTGYQTRAGDGRSVAHGGFPCHAHVGRAVIGRCIKFSSGVLRLCDR
jgi:hypothetical protein